jgi:hypothetical protein
VCVASSPILLHGKFLARGERERERHTAIEFYIFFTCSLKHLLMCINNAGWKDDRHKVNGLVFCCYHEWLTVELKCVAKLIKLCCWVSFFLFFAISLLSFALALLSLGWKQNSLLSLSLSLRAGRKWDTASFSLRYGDSAIRQCEMTTMRSWLIIQDDSPSLSCDSSMRWLHLQQWNWIPYRSLFIILLSRLCFKLIFIHIPSSFAHLCTSI